MIEDIIRIAKELSIKAVRKAGEVTKEHFDNISNIQEKDHFGDVVTEVDHIVEKIILDEISSIFRIIKLIVRKVATTANLVIGYG